MRSNVDAPHRSSYKVIHLLQVTCMDATQKRVAFVQAAAERCGLANVSAVAERCESLGHASGYRECFDVVTARAVAGTRTLVELCLPFVRIGGVLVAAKGPHIQVRATCACQQV